MHRILVSVLSVTIVALIGLRASAPVLSAAMTKATPEEVGLSSERLQRVNDSVRRQIAARNFDHVFAASRSYSSGRSGNHHS